MIVDEMTFRQTAKGGVRLFATQDTTSFPLEDILDDIGQLLGPIRIIIFREVGQVVEGANTKRSASLVNCLCPDRWIVHGDIMDHRLEKKKFMMKMTSSRTMTRMSSQQKKTTT